MSEKNKPHILIVDDERANLRMLSSGLRMDYDISVSTNGHEALKYVDKFLHKRQSGMAMWGIRWSKPETV